MRHNAIQNQKLTVLAIFSPVDAEADAAMMQEGEGDENCENELPANGVELGKGYRTKSDRSMNNAPTIR